jgi:hypothetical protein
MVRALSSHGYDLHSLMVFAPQRIRREVYVWVTLTHNHILPFLGITEEGLFGPLPALVSPWMKNNSLNDYLKREFPELSDHRKLELVGVRRLLCRFILTSDFRYSSWLMVFVIVRPIRSYGIIY